MCIAYKITITVWLTVINKFTGKWAQNYWYDDNNNQKKTKCFFSGASASQNHNSNKNMKKKLVIFTHCLTKVKVVLDKKKFQMEKN